MYINFYNYNNSYRLKGLYKVTVTPTLSIMVNQCVGGQYCIFYNYYYNIALRYMYLSK